MTMVVPVVLAGGSGTRLWPLSRALFPKQFLPLLGQLTLLQQTLTRLDALAIEAPIVICNDEHRFIAAEQLRSVGKLGSILLEPCGRNTAPALALAALVASLGEQYDDDDPLMLVLAADHAVENGQALVDTVERALPLAQSGKLVTFGVVPDSAHTGYGYIQQGEAIDSGFVVEQFVEKPNLQLAQEYVNHGGYLWNSGMFLFRAKRYLDELARFRPDIFSVCQQAAESVAEDLDFVRIDAEIFEQCPADSIDYAVMEATEDAVVVPLEAGWSDIGSWESLWQASSKDQAGNAVHGDALVHDVHNSYLHSQDRLVAVLGLNDLIVVDTADAILVAPQARAQEVKHLVEQLKGQDRPELESHRQVFRPWGSYDAIDYGHRYQVKRITVKPGAKLSVQMHHHRSEHWVVVAGTAKVTNGERTFFITENESTYIPVGVVHALENPGRVPLELIEVQSGTYLGEDDIIRFQDNYGRA